MRRRILALWLPVSSFCSGARADVRLPALLSDHMVLQRDTTTTIWGWADAQEQVRVSATWTDTVAISANAAHRPPSPH